MTENEMVRWCRQVRTREKQLCVHVPPTQEWFPRRLPQKQGAADRNANKVRGGVCGGIQN